MATSGDGSIEFDDGINILNPYGLVGQYRKVSYSTAIGFGIGGSWATLVMQLQ